jgi:tripartite-type tricarboxylate transporter receptor subunit TctC
MGKLKVGLLLFVAALAIGLAISPSTAQNFPSRPVRIVVPFPPGSGTDLLARILAEQLTRKWGSAVIVENLSGAASGNLGAAEVARAAPDGYTLMLCPPGPISTNRLLYKNLTYDPTEWVPISLLASVPYMLVMRRDFEASTVKDLIARAKANPGKFTSASPGVGSTAHLSAAQFEMLAGIKLQTVPYRGLGPAMNDIISGHVDMMFDTITTSLPLHRDGRVKIIGIGSAERASALPEVPTIAESGLPGFRSITWFGFVAPPRTPTALAERINKDLAEIIRSPEITARIRGMNMEPIGSTRAEAAKFFAEETELWGKVIKQANITVE